MRAPLHIGLALAVVLAPALCCCKVGLFRPAVSAAPVRAPDAPVPPPAAPKCAHCCHDDAPQPAPANPTEHQPPQPGAPDSCACCVERPDAAKPEGEQTVPAPEPTGERLPFANLAPGASDHFGRARALPAPGRTGVDARYSALFERHVLRC